ncbi:MAG: alpha/beta fold hydrolase [Cytophagales bacterium]|nr:alpha/beta fold hydrolase [Cytophagales bacterium]
MKLHFRSFGQGDPLIVLHGVFGSSDNWQTVGKELSARFKVYLVDQRNHGSSPHSDEFDYNVMTDDILELMLNENIEQAHLIGHSMGGKVAMTFAARYPDKVNKLIVVDIAPKYYEPHHARIFRGFRSIKLDQIKTRNEADVQMSHRIPETTVRQFILKNLSRDKEGFIWKLNLDVIEQNAEQIGEALSEEDWFNGHVLFLAGTRSDYIQDEDLQVIRQHFPNAEVKKITGAGHWIHAEQPKSLVRLVFDFLT